MEILMSVVIGILFAVAVYLMFSRNIIRVLIGTLLLSHSVHLILFTMAGLQRGAPPLLFLEAEAYADPLPQALILTAIVINFGITAFVSVLVYRTYQEHKTVDLYDLRGEKDE
ncbi:Na(+)/H(+) antiporter subunit C [Salinicoccus halitifaciens]|uniref:Multicomponent Na+:H+ antiporter subunit C n=1 Tax=Salinicoccus halitifaciens TaxID=1073415 RepID=A0ABV2ECU0_9STAP|nr:Na(+)/H(+) antiporter subunit C [Salinicoccus halitifaciens]MCD2138633.1 Na(+)/H(+) antiporter subunit C [Salinicoccus halitifaciens]